MELKVGGSCGDGGSGPPAEPGWDLTHILNNLLTVKVRTWLRM